jgi:hypothetical protein
MATEEGTTQTEALIVVQRKVYLGVVFNSDARRTTYITDTTRAGDLFQLFVHELPPTNCILVTTRIFLTM